MLLMVVYLLWFGVFWCCYLCSGVLGLCWLVGVVCWDLDVFVSSVCCSECLLFIYVFSFSL